MPEWERGTTRAITVLDRRGFQVTDVEPFPAPEKVPEVEPFPAPGNEDDTDEGDVGIPRERYERANGWKLTVYLDGVDVTSRTVFASDRRHYVVLNCRDPEQHTWQRDDGRSHPSNRCTGDGARVTCKHLLKGRVRIVRSQITE